jgi:hypothetical protein
MFNIEPAQDVLAPTPATTRSPAPPEVGADPLAAETIAEPTDPSLPPQPPSMEPLHFSLRSRKIPKVLAIFLTITLCTMLLANGTIQVTPNPAIVPWGSQLELRCSVSSYRHGRLEW